MAKKGSNKYIVNGRCTQLTSNLCSDMSKQDIDMVSPCDLNGAADEFFGSFFEHYDFPMEDLEGNIDWDALQLLQLPSPDELLSTSFSAKLGNENSGSFRSSSERDVKPKINGGSSLGNSETTAESNIFHHKTTIEGKDSSFFPTATTTTCVSVLESGSSWSSSGDNSLQHLGYQFSIPVKRARSKRLRPPTLNPRITMPFTPWLDKRKAKRNNFTTLDEDSGFSGTRKCSHCEVTQTPQWREGPMGPKTLCNACGVRYRSGRLYPEYRPAASPTFVASVHSNSHKKVVEMRKKSSSSISSSKVGNGSINSV